LRNFEIPKKFEILVFCFFLKLVCRRGTKACA
jgi:hypothetical protein